MFVRDIVIFFVSLHYLNSHHSDAKLIDQFLQDPFHRLLYLPLNHFHKEDVEKITNVFKGGRKLWKSNVKILYETEKNNEPVETCQREPFAENCGPDQIIKYSIYSGNATYNLKRNNFYFPDKGETLGLRQKREKPFDPKKYEVKSEEIVRRDDMPSQTGGGLLPIKRFDFNDTVIARFFEYDETTLSNIVIEILEKRCQENYDNAFIEVFKVINQDDYQKRPLNERVFLFRKFLRLYKEYNDEMMRGVMFDMPRRLKNFNIEHFLNKNPKDRDFQSYWQADEEIETRFRSLFHELQRALIERNYEMEQELYELAAPKCEKDINHSQLATDESFEREEQRLRAHAKKYLRRKLHSVAALSTTTADPKIEMDALNTEHFKIEQTILDN